MSDGALTAMPPALSVTPLPDTLVAESEPAHPKRILVVEDSADIRALMEFVLKAHHAEVTTATDGERCGGQTKQIIVLIGPLLADLGQRCE